MYNVISTIIFIRSFIYLCYFLSAIFNLSSLLMNFSVNLFISLFAKFELVYSSLCYCYNKCIIIFTYLSKLFLSYSFILAIPYFILNLTSIDFLGIKDCTVSEHFYSELLNLVTPSYSYIDICLFLITYYSIILYYVKRCTSTIMSEIQNNNYSLIFFFLALFFSSTFIFFAYILNIDTIILLDSIIFIFCFLTIIYLSFFKTDIKDNNYKEYLLIIFVLFAIMLFTLPHFSLFIKTLLNWVIINRKRKAPSTYHSQEGESSSQGNKQNGPKKPNSDSETGLSPEEIKRKRGRERTRKSRAKMSQEQTEEYNAKRRVANMTEQQIEERNVKRRIENMPEEEREVHRAKVASMSRRRIEKRNANELSDTTATPCSPQLSSRDSRQSTFNANRETVSLPPQCDPHISEAHLPPEPFTYKRESSSVSIKEESPE